MINLMSSDKIIIRVSHISKHYQIGGPQEQYHTFRDVIANSLKAPFKAFHRNPPEEGFWALKDVSFDVRQGEVVGIIGRNGAGKSTLLKILSRITSPTDGIVEIHGRVGSLLEVGTGFHPELTGRENIFLSGSILGMKRREIQEKFDEIVRFSEIEEFIDTPVKRYSSGMYVRLAFAVAAHLDPEILIVDEVLAVGDMSFQKKCLGKMKEVSEGGRTVLFVSHNLTSINQLCSRVILLNRGNVLADGLTHETLNSYISMGTVATNDGDLTNPVLRLAISNPNSAIRWTHIRLINSLKETVVKVLYHEPFDVVFRGIAATKCEHILIGFGITSKLNGLIFTTHQAYNGHSTSFPEGLLEFRVSINPNHLAPGQYEIGIAAEGPNVGDWIPNALEFSVLEVGITPVDLWNLPGRNGIIDYPCEWNMEMLSDHK